MRLFIDRHRVGATSAAEIAELHVKDLQVQDRYGVRFLNYWFDPARGNVFCLIEAPDADTAMHAHGAAHGHVASDVIEVELSAVEAFLGRLAGAPAPERGAETHEAAFRAVMFTDIVDSTAMTGRLGDVRALELVRAHDSMVRRALAECGGREVKHTGDGIMACFDEVADALDCACRIQCAFQDFNSASDEPLAVRIGIDAGEPVSDSNDLFGATVQLAARLCEAAAPGTVLISREVGKLAGRRFAVDGLGVRVLKGFPEPVPVLELDWRRAPSM